MKASSLQVYKIVAREVILFKKRAIGSSSHFYYLVYLPKKLGQVCREVETLKELKTVGVQGREFQFKVQEASS